MLHIKLISSPETSEPLSGLPVIPITQVTGPKDPISNVIQIKPGPDWTW
jgi:hypothetical protein